LRPHREIPRPPGRGRTGAGGGARRWRRPRSDAMGPYSDGGVRRRVVRVVLVDCVARVLRRRLVPDVAALLGVRRRRVVVAPETALCTRRCRLRRPRSTVPPAADVPADASLSSCRLSCLFSLISWLTISFKVSTSSAPPCLRRRDVEAALLPLPGGRPRRRGAGVDSSSAMDFGSRLNRVNGSAAGVYNAGHAATRTVCLIHVFSPSRASSCAGLALRLT
jgi:hypothetical protein